MRKFVHGSSAIALAAVVVLAACSEPSPLTVCDPTDPSCNPTPGDTTTTPAALEVVSVTPANGTTGVELDQPVTVTFNRVVDAASVSPSSVQVTGATGDLSTGGSTVTFTPTTQYAAGSVMGVVVNGVTDVDGVGLATVFTSNFTARTLALSVSAGPDFDASIGESVTLDQSVTEGTGATFTWTQLSGPSVGTLSGDTPTFTAPSEVGVVTLEVSGTDGSDTQVDTVQIWVLEDASASIWVSADNGSASGDGSRQAPLASIQAGINAADVTGADVYVASGNYDESLELRSRVSLYGGWDATGWTRDIDAYRPVVSGTATAVFAEQVQDITLEGFEIIAADAAGGDGRSSVAVWLDRTGDILLTRNVLRAGNGTRGSNGVRGNDGSKGVDGSDGGNARTCTTTGGSGGAGAADPQTPDGGRGGTGRLGTGSGGSAAPTQPLGGEGGPGGTSGSKNGGQGEDGERAGSGGTNGAGGESFGALSATGYDATAAVGSTGGRGGAGYGGGGGGGGHGQVMTLVANYCGGGGGGGGAGGRGGFGGTGGTGGGGSFAVMLLGTTTAEITGNEIHTATGGVGGSGGSRGLGGPGGDGGTRGRGICDSIITSACAGRGGHGGNGSAGGPGGYGGGGGGGPSIGILEAAEATLTESANVYAIGSGGAGGFSSGNRGTQGESANHKKITP